VNNQKKLESINEGSDNNTMITTANNIDKTNLQNEHIYNYDGEKDY
jgi:hypothetical protein